MLPADQSLNAGGFPRMDVDDGVIVQNEFVVGKRAAKFALVGASRDGLEPHGRFEKPIGIAAFTLGLVEREVGVLEQLFDICCVRRRQHDADAGADIDDVAVEIERRRYRRQQPIGGGERGALLLFVRRRQNGELVAAEPRHGVGFACARQQPGGHDFEQLIAHGMTE